MAQPVVNYQETDPVTVASRIRQAREELGLTRKQVAEATGIPVKSFEKMEYGQVEPNLSRLKVICHYLDIPIQEIIDEVDTENTRPAAKAGNRDTDDPVTQARRELHGIAEKLGMKVVYPGPGSDPADLVRVGMVDTGEEPPRDMSRAAVLRELESFAEQNGPNAQGVKRRLRDAERDLSAAEMPELLDLAEERGLDFDEELREDDAGDDQAVTNLRTRLLVHALYDVDPAELSAESLARLNVELAGGDPDGWIEPTVVDPKGMFEGGQAFRERTVSAIGTHILDAVRKRAGPDLSDTKHYPRANAQD